MDNLIGQSLGRYHILEPLGEGGMAKVYKAYDTRLERDVAVKVIRTEKLTLETMGKTLKRFEREAKALAKLTHPNIVSITDYGEHDGKPYLVMPFLPGGTLKGQLGGKAMSWEDAVRLLIPVARALHYAHQQGIIHRDVKPSNILITQSGEPMLTDFGIAKILLDDDATADLTGTGMGVGTPEYMSPEQFQGKGVDGRTDIYSLGVVLYEMVTGRKPYQADTPAAVLIKQVTEALPRPKLFNADLPEELEKVLLKSLAKDKEDRYQDFASFGNALENLVMRTGRARASMPSSREQEKYARSYESGKTDTVDDKTYSTRVQPQMDLESARKRTKASDEASQPAVNVPSWQFLLLFVLGWAVGFGVIFPIGIRFHIPMFGEFVGGLIGGAITTLAFRRSGILKTWDGMLWIPMGCAGSLALSNPIIYAFINTNVRGNWVSAFAFGVAGAISGLVVALTLFYDKRITSRAIPWITLGWSAGWSLIRWGADNIQWSLQRSGLAVLDINVSRNYFWVWVFSGAICAAIVGEILLWVMNRYPLSGSDAIDNKYRVWIERSLDILSISVGWGLVWTSIPTIFNIAARNSYSWEAWSVSIGLIGFGLGGFFTVLPLRRKSLLSPRQGLLWVVIAFSLPGAYINLPHEFWFWLFLITLSTGLSSIALLRWNVISSWRTTIWITLGWSVAGAAAILSSQIFLFPSANLLRATAGLLFGAIGGGILLWKIDRERASIDLTV